MRRAELSVKANVNMWKALVRPNLEYGAELWGFGNWEEAEVIQRSVARKILRCKQAVNAGVCGELGLWTMESREISSTEDLLKEACIQYRSLVKRST